MTDVRTDDEEQGPAAPPGEGADGGDDAQRSGGDAMASAGRPVGLLRPITLPLRALANAGAALRYPNFRLVWSGALLSNIGSWMQNIARDWLVYELSGDEGKLLLGLNGFVEGVAVALLLPLGGILADRLDRRRVLIGVNVAQALFAATLAWLAGTGRIEPWHILLMTALNGAGDALRVPSHQSLMPSLVDRGHLTNAVALGSLQFNLSRVIGPSVGGWVLLTLGAAWSFGINAVSFGATILALSLVRVPPRPKRTAEQAERERAFGAGVRYIRTRGDLQMMLGVVLMAGLLAAPLVKLLPAFASEVLHGGEGLFSTLLACFGGGAMLGAIGLASRSAKGPTPWRAMPMLVALGLVQVAAAQWPVVWVAKGLCVAAGALFVGVMVRMNTAVLATAPDALRGRLSGVHQMAFRTGMPAGALLAGWVAHGMGIGGTLQWSGAGLIGGGIAAMIWARRVTWHTRPPEA